MTFASALILGLLASAHCAAMCGGLQGALQQPLVLRSARDSAVHLVLLNLGRISTYVAAGALVSLLGASLFLQIDLPRVTESLRYFAALVLIALGLQLLLQNSKPFRWLEKYGAGLWALARRYLPQQQRSKYRHSFARGLVWGFLPCGLVYGVLASTLFLTNTVDATLVMLGFALGTLPAMLLTGGAYRSFRALVRNRAVQALGGAIFIQGGVFIVLAPRLVNMEFMGAYPQLVSSLFCVS